MSPRDIVDNLDAAFADTLCTKVKIAVERPPPPALLN